MSVPVSLDRRQSLSAQPPLGLGDRRVQADRRTAPSTPASGGQRAGDVAPTADPLESVARKLMADNPVIPKPTTPAKELSDAEAAEAFKQALIRNLPKWPHQTDGTIARSDLDKVVKNRDLHGEDAAVVGVVLDNFEDLSKPHGGKFITLDDIQKGDLGSKFSDGVELLKTASHKLFEGRPDWRALQQGGIGDCWFLSPLTNEARLHPDALVGMAKDNGDSVTITFPQHAPQTVAKPTDSEIVAYASGGANGLWPTVFEQAMEAVYHPGLNPIDEPGDDASNGVKLLTGHDAVTEANKEVTLQHISDRIDATLKAGKSVECSTYDKEYESGLIGDHVYTVLHYDPKSQMIVLRNPWGKGTPVPDGYIDLGHYTQDGEGYGIIAAPLKRVVEDFEDMTCQS